jgi:dsDNA-specific endonuclease/ATPase MutS2
MAGSEHEYDFHGMRAHEAERRLKALLDRHGRQSGATLAIVHGKGAGVLAKVVAETARRHPKVAHVQRGWVNDGVTRIELR